MDSLEHIELAFLLEEAGVRLNEAQFSRLRPYLAPLRRLDSVSGQLHTKAEAFARRGYTVLAIDRTFAQLLVGQTDDASTLQGAKRYTSPEMALRVFLSDTEGGGHGL